MATAVTAKSILTSTRRSLDTLAAKVKTGVAKSTGHKVDHVLAYLGVENGPNPVASSIIIDITVLAVGYPGSVYPDKNDVLAAVKKASGCRAAHILFDRDQQSPRGTRYEIECAVGSTVSSFASFPPAVFT